MPHYQDQPMTWTKAIAILIGICALVWLLFLGVWACTEYIKPDPRPVPAPTAPLETRSS